MCPENARVFIAEDSRNWRDLIEIVLEEAGHEVVITATSREEAFKAIDQLTEMRVQVAILDGSLGSSPDYKTHNKDGIDLLAQIKQVAPDVKTVGFASVGRIPGTDVDLGKDTSRLAEVVTRL